MNIPIANHSRKVLLALSASCALLLPACLPPPPGVHVRAVVSNPGYYDRVPHNYHGSYYQHDGRYYYGGRHDVGHYHWNGQDYDSRYYHSGRYYYGGRHYDPYQ